MAKYIATKNESIGAKLVGNGKALVAYEVNGRKFVELIDETSDILDKALPVIQKVIQQLVDFFNSVFHRFPTVIVIAGVRYVYTIQPSPFKGIDRVFYMNEEDKNDCIFQHEAQRMPEAKKGLKEELKDLGYL